MKKVDEKLEGKKRRLRTKPDKILMDAGGYRLWADYMDIEPGFSGCFDFIHKINIPCLFRMKCSAISDYSSAKISWKPSHVTLLYEKDGITLTENKFITLGDEAVSCMVWENESDVPFQVIFEPGTSNGRFPTTYEKELGADFYCNGCRTQKRVWDVLPGAKMEICAIAQIYLKEEIQEKEQQRKNVQEKYSHIQNALDTQIREYQSWFDWVPEFTSSNSVIDKTWAYRWYIFRRNMMNPGIGNLKETFFSEGRSHKMSKEPYKPEGWEFSKLIPLSVPMHLLDLRWYQTKEYGASVLHVMRDNQDDAGEFHCAKVNWRGNAYANFFGWSVWQYYLVSGDREYAMEALPVVKKQLLGWKKRYGNNEDTLLIQYVHQLTGMEYQPSYWYFHKFPEDCTDASKFTPMKRVDRNVYYYLNTKAVAELCRICEDPEEGEYLRTAEKVEKDILEKMWDEKSGFFYDLHYMTNEKAYVKNIVGVFPFFAGITAEKHTRCLETLFTPEFATECPFPSVSTECPVFTAEGGWQGHFFKGRNGCIWNGPTWPFANSIVLDGLGQESQRRNHKWDKEFGLYFKKFTDMHYYGGDGETPYLVEHYNSMSGECISDEADYSHSYYIDLVVRFIAGISVHEDKIVVDPLDVGLTYFELSGLYIRGHKINICLSEKTGRFSVIVDEKESAARKGLGRLEVAL